RLRVGVEGKEERVGAEVVVGRELGLDVRRRDPPTDPKLCALEDPRKVDVEVLLGRIEAIELVVLQELIAEPTASRRVAIVAAIEERRTEAPVDVICLNRVGRALDPEDELVQ